VGFLSDLGGWKIVILIVVLLVLFGGATKLPIFAKGLGQSVRVFRKEMTGVKDDIDAEKKTKGRTKAEPIKYSEGVDGESTGNDLAHDPVFVTKDPPAAADLPPKATVPSTEASGAPKS
jgi:sec-independent protein translocase protein TatA